MRNKKRGGQARQGFAGCGPAGRWQKPTTAREVRSGCASCPAAVCQKLSISDSFGEIPMKIFETLVVIGFALRYHSKRRIAGRPQGTPGGAPRRPGCCAVPSRTAIDGPFRARIIGASALFVST
ncbi:hypothetical protein [Burkholderia guangdongensis]|uniref:hypothetical protein n=1 Tax=Burkholderia guangdongensis TaxID=1792500 RepID=UPI0015C79482|nr:hypothetical protein [Burkholderia guangdongensis]